ncbi:MAG: type I DNA topoisomerase [Phycisphaerae bacterium]
MAESQGAPGKRKSKTGGRGKTSSKRSNRARSSSARSNGRALVVVESPAKARTINRYLGDDYVVKASMGHVRDLPKKEIGVAVDKDFTPTYQPLPGRKKVLDDLRKTARNAPSVYLATDLDREGEAIAWHLKEALGLDEQRAKRVVFNQITADAIRQAFADPHDVDMNKVNAQQARRILDRIVGYMISPLLWRKVAPGLSAGRVQTVAVRLIVQREREIEAFQPEEYWRISSIFTSDTDAAGELGRAWRELLAQRDEDGKGPTQAQKQEFLADRGAFEAELVGIDGERFKVEKSDEAVEVAKSLGLTVEKLEQSEDEEAKPPANKLVTVHGHVGEEAPEYTVRNVKQRESRSRPPAPFTTASMQQTASVRLRFAASRTMRIAQQLYEGVEVPGEGSVGLITYMRTDSTNLANEAVSAVRSYITEQFGDAYAPEKPNRFTSAARAQQAHEAIRPTDVTRTPQKLRDVLDRDQYRLYELIWKRFVACQMSPAVWKVTEAEIVATTTDGQHEAVFKAMGRRLAFDGYMKVAGMPKSGEQILPELSDGQPVAPAAIEPTQHFTQPPPRYTEASLVKALEAEGIGRPSTYAQIIQTIEDRDYVRREDRSFHPTDLGTLVTDKLVKHFPRVFDVRFTAHLEDELDRVEEAEIDWVSVLREFYEPFKANLEAAGENMVHAKAEQEPSDYVCENCGKPMVYRFSKNGRYLACTGYPECKTTHPVDEKGRKIERKEVDVPCPVCGKSPMILRRSRYGPFLGCSDYPDCKGTMPATKDGKPVKTVKPEEIKETCDVCGAPMEVKFKGRRAFLGCSRYPDCKNTKKLPEGVRVEPPPKAKPREAGVNCPKCGKPMVIRTGKRGEFLACSGFPKCRNAMDLDKLDELKRQQGAGGGTAGKTEDEKPKKSTSKKSSKKKSSGKKSSRKSSKKSAKKPTKDEQ